ncbi:uncharacterized protein MKZ38_008734 [Zalerion maritima]|uniref:Uncharacterized protein n=1 Tax=Zalerion maritima TaxID=339359 RepID=A0AAD5WMK5_9PEZI|nr:uncharacterized protein MKZ38_008734 [Zalerion maritima]
MDPTNTIGLVSALATTYESALLEYLEYSRRIWLSNNYASRLQRTGSGGAGEADSPSDPTPFVPGPSALRASLTVSPRRIRETYDRAFILIGPEFSRGDGRSRGALTAALSLLRTTLAPLSEALAHVPTRPRSPPPMVDLHGMTFATNKVFQSVTTTLAHQYQRQALSRPVPRFLPGVKVARAPSPNHHSGTLEMLEEGDEKEMMRPMEDDECSITPNDSITQVGLARELERERQERHERRERRRERNSSPRRERAQRASPGQQLRPANDDEEVKESRRSWRDWGSSDISRQTFHTAATSSKSDAEEALREAAQREPFRSSLFPIPPQEKSDTSSESQSQGTGTDSKRNSGGIDDSKFKKRTKARSWTTDPPSPPPTPPNTLLDQSEGGSERCMSPGGMRRIVEESEEEEHPGTRTDSEPQQKKPGDAESVYAPPMSPIMSPISAVGGALPLRPKNSVFRVFCPEALALQVDSTRALPAPESKCRQCTFNFPCAAAPAPPAPEKPVMSPKISAFLQSAAANSGRKGSTSSASSETSAKTGEMRLKEGFRLTGRFLAKSHCEGGKGYGCVLCTSSGWTDRYASAEELRDHLNERHTKWQMLHDADMK